jgi:thiol-disulfide isomerase/thioredoxin
MRHCLPCLFVMLCCQLISTGVHSQIPKNEIALEDAAFDKIFAGRNIPTVTGKLLNISAEELKDLYITYSRVTPFSTGSAQGTVTPKPDGSFSIPIDYAFPYQEIYFTVDTLFYTGLCINKDLYLELDVKKLKSAKSIIKYNGDGVRYLGTDASLNIYQNNFTLYQQDEQIRLMRNSLMLLYGPGRAKKENILPEYNKIQDSIKAIENSFIAANPSPYSWMFENERLSEYYARICDYYSGKIIDDTLWQKIKQHKAYILSNRGTSFYSHLSTYISSLPGKPRTSWKDVAELPDLDATEKALIDSLRDSETRMPVPPYTKENIKKWNKELRPRIQKLAFIKSLKRDIASADSLFTTAKADFMKLQLRTGNDGNDPKEVLDYILNSIHSSWCSTVLKKEYIRINGKANEINEALARGNANITSLGKPLLETPFGASLYKAEAEIKALDFLVRLRQNFPGKAILIDLWATWCAPCLGEMPHSKKLQEASTDLPVVFIYLSTTDDSSEDEWKAKVADLKQPGVHILINEKLTAELSGYFSFTGYPGHAFIDKKGQYRPGVIRYISDIPDKNALTTLINK